MKKLIPAACVAALVAVSLLPALGEAPAKIAEVAPVEALAAEARDKVAALEELLSASEPADAKKVAQAAGVLAAVSQALVEHPEKSKANMAAADLRDAGVKIAKSKAPEEWKAGLAAAKEALAGKASGNAKEDYEWNKLVNLHRLMEEVNFRNARLRRVIRRPSGEAADARHASTLAVLALAIHADTHEVKDPNLVPKWQGYSLEFQKSMTEVAAALRNKNADAAKAAFTKANQACNACHTDFRKEE